MCQNQATYSELQYPNPNERVARHKDRHLSSTLSDKILKKKNEIPNNHGSLVQDVTLINQ